MQDTFEKQIKPAGGELALHVLKAEHEVLLAFGLCMAPIMTRTDCCVKKNFQFLFGVVREAEQRMVG
ncbi:MAG: hypothetical protein CMJ19_08085 [Phycisphaeraceae bacterium]|nr:hypothetical protein [Phycisphaeraceae bacterium]